MTDRLLANNAQSHWVPGFVQEKRFANWLANARDWNISRNRYWGTPIPLWVSEDYEEVVCIGSVEELKKLSGHQGPLDDLHRDSIDHITIPSSRPGKPPLRRIEEVFDCWFESGSMPYAQNHYPFENRETFESNFPADFIAEGLDQTRGWFYTLLVLSTHLFDKPMTKNLIVNGLVLAADGKKMSKKLKNYPPPTDVINQFGADALRLYLINSPVVRAETLKFKEEGVREVVSKVLLPWLNAHRFWVTQASLLERMTGKPFQYDEIKAADLVLGTGTTSTRKANVMDRWILASAQSLIRYVRQEMGAYRLYTVVPRLLGFIDELTNWYVRFNRLRLKGEKGEEEAVASLTTLFQVLFTLCRLMAPFTPFLVENMYQALRPHLVDQEDGVDRRSVHFLLIPEPDERYADEGIERSVSRMQTVIEQGRIIRERRTIGLKTPLSQLIVVHADPQYRSDLLSLERYIVEELNVRSLLVTEDEEAYGVRYRMEADFRVLGQKLKKDMPKVKKALPTLGVEAIRGYLEKGEVDVEGIRLSLGDLQVVRYHESSSMTQVGEKGAQYESASDGEGIILLDVCLRPELVEEGLAREVVNRVQRLRKKAGLVASDTSIKYLYTLGKDPEGQLAPILTPGEKQMSGIIGRTLKQGLELRPSSGEVDGEIVMEEEQEVSGSTFTLVLVRKA